MSEDVQLQPDTAAVLQEEEPPGLTTVPVCVEDIRGPVRVKQLPDLPGGTRTVTAPVDAPARHILTPDRYRSRALLVSHDDDLLVAFTENDASDPSTMARWPKGVPLEIRAVADVYVMGNAADTAVGVVTERWAASE